MPMSDPRLGRLADAALPGIGVAVSVVALLGIGALLLPDAPSEPPAQVMLTSAARGSAEEARSSMVRRASDHFAQRPLFHASRAQWEPPAEPAAVVPAAAATPEPRLLGIVGSGERFLALLQGDGASARPVAPGETVGPWRVLAIDADRVEVESERGERAVLTLRRLE